LNLVQIASQRAVQFVVLDPNGNTIIAPGSMLTATLGARAAHSLSRRRLSQAFGIFLLLVGSRMVYRAFA